MCKIISLRWCTAIQCTIICWFVYFINEINDDACTHTWAKFFSLRQKWFDKNKMFLSHQAKNNYTSKLSIAICDAQIKEVLLEHESHKWMWRRNFDNCVNVSNFLCARRCECVLCTENTCRRVKIWLIFCSTQFRR